MYFEDFQLGLEMVTPSRTITETDVVTFAALSGDWNQLHTDVEYAKATPFGQRIAHGLLGLAVASGLAVRLGFIDGTAIAFRSLEWKFSAPIFLGDTIAVQVRVAETKPVPRLGGGSVTFDVALVNQRGETVQRGTWSMLVKSRE
ncbi:MAG: dehydratase [Chloroflexi bacterium RBG_16_57_9]|nr:MAG: dehydratase [Chloroflexi bacterium RBG_16_57_9]